MGIVVHVVDASMDGDLQRFEDKSSKKKDDVVISLGAMCNGVQQASNDVSRNTMDGSIDALIFYGHGPDQGGAQGVSTGKDGRGVREGAALTVNALADKTTLSLLGQLTRKFSSRGVIVLRGCHAARGEEGDELLKAISKAVSVPVKGSDWYQIVGKSNLAGNIITATPDRNIDKDRKEGLKNLGGYPPGEGLYLLGCEVGLRLMELFNVSATKPQH